MKITEFKDRFPDEHSCRIDFKLKREKEALMERADMWELNSTMPFEEFKAQLFQTQTSLKQMHLKRAA